MATYKSFQEFPWEQYVKENPSLVGGGSIDAAHEGQRAWQDYLSKGSTWKLGGTNTPTTNTPNTNQGTTPTIKDLTQYNQSGQTAQVVPANANPNAPNQINVTDYAGQVATNPSLGMVQDNPATPNNESMSLVSQGKNSQMTVADQWNNGTLVANSPHTQPNTNFAIPNSSIGNTSTVNLQSPRQANTYDAATMSQDVQDMQAAQGKLSDGAIINPDNGINLDTEAIGQGRTQTGQALKQAAYQELGPVLDSRNPLEAAQMKALGKFGYVDSKATVEGQLAILQEQFTDAQGNPRIPAWASGTARNVAKIASFSGMTGSAATQAMAQAIMEASLPIATADAQFFQTLTLTNLSNEQQAILNRANVLSKMDMANMDNRMAAAVQNAQNFLQMDLANLSNEQQEQLVNTQQRFQALLEDSKQENAARLFGAEAKNDMQQYYDTLNTQMKQFNATQLNATRQLNANNLQAARMFNANLNNQREQFYAQQQMAIDLANAQWRQQITLVEDQQSFEAAATDVKNMLDISQEQLNQLWDRSDALLDYIWKSGENEADRNTQLALAKLAADANLDIAKFQADVADSQGMGSIFGTIAGNASASFFKDFDWGSLF